MTETIKEALTGAAFTVVFGWIATCLAWASKTNERLSVVETQQENVSKWLERVEDKLDHVIEGRRR